MSNTAAIQGEPWPEGVPFTQENLAILQQDYNVYIRESNYALPVIEDADADQWTQTGQGVINDPAKLREKCRELAHHEPTGKRVIDLYRYYVMGGGVSVKIRASDSDAAEIENKVTKRATAILKKRLKEVQPHLSWGEMGTRRRRDGEVFIRRSVVDGTSHYRFIDPEDVVDADGSEQGGIETAPDDVVSVTKYILSRQKYDDQGAPDGYVSYAHVEPEDMIHVKCDADSTEKRGRLGLVACMDALRKFRNLLINEVALRQNQSAIVMVRKVSGGTGAATRIIDAAKSSTSAANENYTGQDKLRPGTTLTTTKGVEVSFAHPDNNFSDAGPLLTTLLREVSKATGFSFEMLSCDTSEGSLASALIAESPVMQMILEERVMWSMYLQKLFMWMLEDQGVNWDKYEVEVLYPNVETKDKLKDAQTANLGVMANSLSRKEMSRRLGADPEQMVAEIEAESKLPFINPMYAAQNPTMDDKATSSAGNARASGTNQGDKPSAGSADPGKQGVQ